MPSLSRAVCVYSHFVCATYAFVLAMGPPTCRCGGPCAKRTCSAAQLCGAALNAKWGVDATTGGKRPRAEWQCPSCHDLLRCKQCCTCLKDGWGGGGTRVVSSASSAAPHGIERALSQAPLAPPLAVAAPAAAPSVADRARSRSREGRRCDRATIADRLQRQWRLVDTASRPLPNTPGRFDDGIVPGLVWADGLCGEGLVRTRELLNGERWRREQTHSSVHLTLYLQWAQYQLARLDAAEAARASSRQGGLELGRLIQNYM